MDPSAFADILEGLLERVKSSSSNSVTQSTERNNIRSVVGAWFQYRKFFTEMLGDESALHHLDKQFEALLNLTAAPASRRRIIKEIRLAHRHFTGTLLIPLSRAYWSRAPERAPAGRDHEVASRLRDLDHELASSYEQAALDLEEDARITYRGSAAELREVLTGVLHILAPTEKVQSTDWYQEARRSGQRKEKEPTRAERTKFILRARMKGSSATEAAEAVLSSVEERLGNVVAATYKRGSAATHTGSEREEVAQQLQYLNALLRELLPSRPDTS